MSQQHIYLNTASCGLISPESLSDGDSLYKDFKHNASGASEAWRLNEEAATRQLIATFIGAKTKNVAMVPNFSWAINGIIQSLKGTERVLLYAGDYPSFLDPFRINNFNITWVDAPDGFHIEMDKVREAISTSAVDIVAISHVQWSSGYKTDLKEIGDLCKQHGVLFIVDATQSLGANELNLAELNIDVMAASNYKWMNAGFGTGILYVSDRFLEKYTPVVGGHNSYNGPRNYQMTGSDWGYTPSILSYEPGSPNMFGLRVLADAIKHKNELGIGGIAAHNLGLTASLLAGLRDTQVRLLGDYTLINRAPIVYTHDENGLGDYIRHNNIIVTQRNGFLRVSMHYYNTLEDVNGFLDCINAFYVQR